MGVNLKLDFFDKSTAQMHKNTKLNLLGLKFSTTMKKILKRVIV